MQLSIAPHVASGIALVGAGIIAITPPTTPLPAVHPIKVATVHSADLLSLSSSLAGIVDGLKTAVDTGAVALETSTEHRRRIHSGPRGRGRQHPRRRTRVGPQSLTTLGLGLRIGSQLAFDAVEFVPLEAANLTDVVADTVIGLLNKVPAPLVAATAAVTKLPAKATATHTLTVVKSSDSVHRHSTGIRHAGAHSHRSK